MGEPGQGCQDEDGLMPEAAQKNIHHEGQKDTKESKYGFEELRAASTLPSAALPFPWRPSFLLSGLTF
jgi:hypothetical protein